MYTKFGVQGEVRMKTRSAISELAREAKNRLRLMSRGGATSGYKMNVMSKEDCSLYEKVCKIMDRDAVVTNPIHELIDREYYDRLAPDAQQRYILYLSEKYLQLKARYIQERSVRVS